MICMVSFCTLAKQLNHQQGNSFLFFLPVVLCNGKTLGTKTKKPNELKQSTDNKNLIV